MKQIEKLDIYFIVFYNLISKAICSACTGVCLQIFVYNCVFWKKEKKTHETFHILKMKTHSETHFENENLFLPFGKGGENLNLNLVLKLDMN